MRPTHRVLVLNDDGRPITRRISFAKPRMIADTSYLILVDRDGQEIWLSPGVFNCIVIDPWDPSQKKEEG